MRILQIFYTVLLCIIYLNREQENSFETSVDKRSVQIEERNNIEKTAKINNLKATDNAVFIIKNEEQIENAIPYKSKTFWYESWLKIKSSSESNTVELTGNEGPRWNSPNNWADAWGTSSL